jgi:hypothetical protein
LDALPWLDDDLVPGYESGDDAYAYPINLLNFHEILNDTIGGVPVPIVSIPLELYRGRVQSGIGRPDSHIWQHQRPVSV